MNMNIYIYICTCLTSMKLKVEATENRPLAPKGNSSEPTPVLQKWAFVVSLREGIASKFHELGSMMQ